MLIIIFRDTNWRSKSRNHKFALYPSEMNLLHEYQTFDKISWTKYNLTPEPIKRRRECNGMLNTWNWFTNSSADMPARRQKPPRSQESKETQLIMQPNRNCWNSAATQNYPQWDKIKIDCWVLPTLKNNLYLFRKCVILFTRIHFHFYPFKWILKFSIFFRWNMSLINCEFVWSLLFLF
jgi:hypothetical protein